MALVDVEGVTSVAHTVATARAAGCDPVLVVLGAEADRVRAAIDVGDCVLVDNPGWKSGVGSSLRAGLEALAATDAAAVVVLPADTPGVTAAAVRVVVDGAGPDSLVTATYEQRRGHPVLLGREHWAGVAMLASGDVGSRAYLAARSATVRAVPCDGLADDTPIA